MMKILGHPTLWWCSVAIQKEYMTERVKSGQKSNRNFSSQQLGYKLATYDDTKLHFSNL
jgi:hypothetical protein